MATRPTTPMRVAALLVPLLLASACQGERALGPAGPLPGAEPERLAGARPPAADAATAAELAPVADYLHREIATLRGATAALREAAEQYSGLAAARGYDYSALWREDAEAVTELLSRARAAWLAASPAYERVEGIVAGVPSLAGFDVILDSGSSAEEGGENVAPVDLTLDDGRVLVRPGNLFGVTESTLWGSFPAFTVPGLVPDLNGNGQVDFGEALPDARVLSAGAIALDEEAGRLAEAAAAWRPTPTDSFTALVVMVPTMSEYFASWKASRFILGEASTQRDFVAVSRLADIQDILSGLQVVYRALGPRVAAVDPARDEDISRGLDELKAFVAEVQAQERAGRRYQPAEADLLGAQAQDRASAITGQIAQAAAQLGIALQE